MIQPISIDWQPGSRDGLAIAVVGDSQKREGNDHSGLPKKGRREEDMNKGKEQGFTLIELLVVVAIIGILAAIAIPQYATYKQQAADSKAKSDLHNMATAMEAYYGSNNNSYSNTSLAGLKIYGFRQSSGVADTIVTANQTAYQFTANPTGGTATWSFDSTTGQIVSGS
jgi:type IV pilus assembly protein PilA